MYLEQKLNPISVVYNLNIAAIIKGADIGKIKEALNAVFKAYEAFYSYYGEENGLPVRILSDKLPEIIEKTASSREEVISIIDSYAEPFDLNTGIPVRPTLYSVADGSVILHLAIHHIAFDGGSAKTFVSELVDGLNGREVTASEIDLSDLYSDSLEAKYESGLKYYREIFSDGVPVNEMPTKGKRPKVHPLSDREIDFDIDNEKLKAIDNTARKFSVTEFELIFSAVSMTLGKYTSSEDVVLGIPTNMRPNGADNVIGMFVNTAPVRVRPKRTAEIQEYLQSVSEAVRSVTYGAYLPFEDVVAEFVKQRDESRNPMFDVSVNFMWNPPAYNKDGLSVEMYSPLQKMSRDIGIVIRKGAKGLHFMVQYSSELFEDELIENFIEQLRSAIDLMGTANTVRDALVLPEKQKAQLDKFAVEAKEEISITLLHRLFEKSVSETPDKTALIAKDAELTYDELNKRANIVAHNLIDRGIKTGDSVALLLPRESCFFACLFGVNKAGAAFIPCDPQYPADRINHIITDSEASFIITTADKLSDYPADKAINVEDITKGEKTEDPDIKMSDRELAYMIYTSGSTGKPKGVMLRHKGICNYLMPHPANSHIYYLKNNVSTYLSVTTVSFDMSFKEHTAAFCNGKTLVFAAEDEMNDPRALAELMEKYNVDCINATPSRLQQYLEYAPFKDALSKCRLVMSGGEGYPMSLRDTIKECSKEIKIVNTYGPTEITVSCNAADLTNASQVTVGRPLLNYNEVIVDKFGDVSPYGVVGELYIGGVGVAKGYRNLPEKTAQAFVEFGGQRMYRSGDYAKWDKDGNVLITGATGYMGAHLLAEFLKRESGKAYCMVRKGRFETAAERLENMMFYYFGSDLEDEFKSRVEVLNGDVTDYKYFEPFEAMPINTVFNCAANVRHFSNGTDIEDINVGGAVNCIKLCQKLNARLIHFSTVSVSGTTDDVSKLSRRELDEQTLYYGQTLDNKYTSSKLMGERMVLEAAAEGLDAKVIRVGTLAARESDGEFQINFLTNNFMGRLRSYSLLGCFPYSMIENQVCMGPIDRSCEAFLKLAKTPKECCVFNAVNNHTLPLGDIIRQMNENGSKVDFVEYDEFAAALHEAQKDPDKAAILSSMTAYMNTAHGKKIVAIPFNAHYTTQILARMGFFWNASNEKYVNDFINVLRGFMFFRKDNLKR